MREAMVQFDASFDLARTIGVLKFGPWDPTARWSGGTFVKAMRTPQGEAIWRAEQTDAQTVRVEANGGGAAWMTENAASILGAGDDPNTLVPQHGIVRTLHARFSGLRVMRTTRVFDQLVPVIIAQKVVTEDAHQAYQRLARRYGEKIDGEQVMFPPPPASLAAITYPDYHRCGLERKRAETIRFAAKRAKRIDECAEMPMANAYERLLSLPGIGPWTAGAVAAAALGDSDAVLVGDFHIPNTVAWALAGEARGDDERMLELLEPYRGHRWRVVRYLTLAGIAAPRRGPRLARIDVSKL